MRMPSFASRGLTVRRAVVFAVLLGVFVPALVVGLYLARVLYQDTLQAEVARTLKRETAIVALGVRESLWALDSQTASALVDAIMRDEHLVQIEVLDPQLGRFVFREEPARRAGRLHEAEQDIIHRGETIGRVRIEISDAPFAQSLRAQMKTLAGMLALQMGGSVLLILVVLQQRLGAPLNRLSEETARLAKGELDIPIVAMRQDEIGDVESQLEITRQSLQGLIRTLEQKNLTLEVDLRERMRVEAALRDREQRLRALVEQSPIAVVEYDLGWHILEWNEAAVRIFGWHRDQVIGRHHAFLAAPGHEQESAELTEHIERHLTGTTQTSSNLRANGDVIICQWYNNVIRDGSGTPLRIVCMVEDITERQRAYDEIRRLATVVRLTTNLVALTNAHGCIEWSNEAFSRRSGHSPQMLQGAPLLAVLGGDPSASGFAALDRALQHGETMQETELPCQSQSGERYWVSAEVQPIRSADGSLLQCVALLTDITERRRMADALQALARIVPGVEPANFIEQLLAALGRGARAQATYLALHGDAADSVNVVATWSDTFARMPTGVHAQGVLAARLRSGELLAFRDGLPDALKADPLLASYDPLHALVAVPIHDGGNAVIGHVAMLFSEHIDNANDALSLIELCAGRAGAEFARLRALEALQHSEQKFSSIFQHSPIPLALIRQSDGVYLDVNPAEMETFGYAREAVVGRTAAQIGFYADASDEELLAASVRGGGHVNGFGLKLKDSQGQVRDCQVHIRSVYMNEPCLLAAVVDVTPLQDAQRQVEELNQSLERRVTERTRDLASANLELETALERLQRTRDELVRSEKLAALGSLVAGVAHELNTPIGNSLMVASTLADIGREFKRQMDLGLKRSTLAAYVEENESAADILQRNLQRAAELIASFKQVAVDQTSSQRRVFDLNEVVHEIVLTMQPAFRKSPYRVVTDIPPDVWMDSYPGPFGQVVTNLLNNTIMHAFEGRSEGIVQLSAELGDDNDVFFICKDNGVGISPTNLRKIFDPFFTTKLGQQGTGLGLNIVHNIVTGVLGGEIEVNSEANAGTTFSLRLPLTAPRQADSDDDT